MYTFIWYKIKIIQHGSAKKLFMPIVGIGLLVLYNILHLQQTTIYTFYPLVFITFSTYGLFSIGDLLRTHLFVAINDSIRKLWIANIIFVIISSGLFVIIMLLVYFAAGNIFNLLYVNINIKELLYIIILSIPIEFFMIGMSTIHFYDYGKFTTIISSIFALFNLAIIALPIGIEFYHIEYKKYILPLSLICLFVSVGLFCLMGHPKIDDLIFNTQKEVGTYDKKMLSLDD